MLKTANLQTAQADTKPKFAKELFSLLIHHVKLKNDINVRRIQKSII